MVANRIEHFNALLDQLREEAIQGGVSPETETEIVSLFNGSRVEDEMSLQAATHLAELLAILNQNQDPDATAEHELTEEHLLQVFREFVVVLAVGIEVGFITDERLQTYLGVLRTHYLRHFFIDVASDQIGSDLPVWGEVASQLLAE